MVVRQVGYIVLGMGLGLSPEAVPNLGSSLRSPVTVLLREERHHNQGDENGTEGTPKNDCSCS